MCYKDYQYMLYIALFNYCLGSTRRYHEPDVQMSSNLMMVFLETQPDKGTIQGHFKQGKHCGPSPEPY